MFQSRPAKATSPREPSALAGVLLKGMLARICWPRCIHRSCLVKGMRLDTAPGLLVMEGDLPAELRQARALGSKERGRGEPIDPDQAREFVGGVSHRRWKSRRGVGCREWILRGRNDRGGDTPLGSVVGAVGPPP